MSRMAVTEVTDLFVTPFCNLCAGDTFKVADDGCGVFNVLLEDKSVAEFPSGKKYSSSRFSDVKVRLITVECSIR